MRLGVRRVDRGCRRGIRLRWRLQRSRRTWRQLSGLLVPGIYVMGKYEGAYSTLQVGIWRIEVVHVLVRTDPGTHRTDSFISMVYIYVYILSR